MNQIFMSHSGRDQKFKDFFNSVFSSSGVKGVFEEYEAMVSGQVSSPKIAKDIQSSDAIFIVLTETIQDIPHTRDWILWEAGVAQNKPIWVFEPHEQTGRVSVLIPRLNHHVVFCVNDSWFAYVKNIIESYDSSNALPAALTGAALLAIAFNPLLGLVGAAGGALITNKSNLRPSGKLIRCCHCTSVYSVHLSAGVLGARCPVCNTALRINQPQGAINATK